MGESMSKGKEVVNRERLLLEEIDKYSRIYGECLPANLADTLQEVLSQPEQEPVYWGNEKKALLNEIDHLTNRLAQPEQETITPRQGLEEYKRGYAKAELDLKREPLGLEEINECMANSDSFGFNGDVYIADGDNAFENFARAIEKAHGIGVDDE